MHGRNLIVAELFYGIEMPGEADTRTKWCQLLGILVVECLLVQRDDVSEM